MKYPSQHELELQRLAERAEREQAPTGDPQVDRYRLVLRALRRPLATELDADFTATVLQRIARRERQSALEDSIVTVMLLLLSIGGAAFAIPYLAPFIAEMGATVPLADGLLGEARRLLVQLPWPTLIGTGLCIGCVMLIDHLLSRRTAVPG
jgi:hypothetical protein